MSRPKQRRSAHARGREEAREDGGGVVVRRRPGQRHEGRGRSGRNRSAVARGVGYGHRRHQRCYPSRWYGEFGRRWELLPSGMGCKAARGLHGENLSKNRRRTGEIAEIRTCKQIVFKLAGYTIITRRPVGLMDTAPVFGTGDSGFESLAGLREAIFCQSISFFFISFCLSLCVVAFALAGLSALGASLCWFWSPSSHPFAFLGVLGFC